MFISYYFAIHFFFAYYLILFVYYLFFILLLSSDSFQKHHSVLKQKKNFLFMFILYSHIYIYNSNYSECSNDNSLQLSGLPDMQIVVNTSLPTVSSTVFRTPVSLQLLSCLITHQRRNNPRTPRDHDNASCSQEMYTQTLALL